jgi:hypothetical protein
MNFNVHVIFLFIFGLLVASLSWGVTCSTNIQASEDCVIETAGLYVYKLQYGGHTNAGAASITVGNGVGAHVLPAGYYSGSTITFSDANINGANAANIKNGVSIFGVAGSYVSTAYAGCDMSGGGGLASAQCSAPANSYNYSTDKNGRSANCGNINTGTTNGAACWINTSSTLIIGNSNPGSATCSAQGLQASKCKGNSGTYQYTDSYGGRSLACNSGYNADPCWLATTGNMVGNSVPACTNNSLNASSCTAAAGSYVYAGQYGGRTATCTNDSAGLCYVTDPSKTALDSNLAANNIKLGVSIFGVSGTFSGNGDWASAAHRNSTANQIGFGGESSIYSANGSSPNLPGGYRMVPQMGTNGIADDDGYTNVSVTKVDRTGWGTSSCGTIQNTLTARILDCANVFGVNATWDGPLYGNAGQARWRLVTRLGDVSAGKGREVWQDTLTGQLWSSLISKSINWCKASGSSNNPGVAAAYREVDPNGYCSGTTYQVQVGSVTSGCFEGSGFGTDASVDNNGKANLSSTASGTAPAVGWRIPTMNDYEIADYHGIRFVMPDMGSSGSGEEWTATISSANTNNAWTYSSTVGSHSSRSRTNNFSARCVGR